MYESGVRVDVTIPNQTRYLSLVGSIGENLGKKLKACPADSDLLAYQLNLVLTEAISNAIRHGGAPADAPYEVRVHIVASERDLWVRVYDQGQGFDLDTLPLPEIDSLAERGRGLFLIRTLMDSVQYHRTEQGNVLEMRKSLA
jgi:serine/threonine-protein kinase RsbW